MGWGSERKGAGRGSGDGRGGEGERFEVFWGEF